MKSDNMTIEIENINKNFVHINGSELRKSITISVCIPTYNRSSFILEAVESVLLQDYFNCEIVIVDDGSIDNTYEVLRKFNFRNIRYIKKEHSGAPSTRNKCVKEAKGDYILWLDSDDTLMAGALENYEIEIKNHKDVDIFYGDLYVTDNKLQIISSISYPDWYKKNNKLIAKMFYENPIPNPGVLIRKNCYQKIGYYNEEFHRAHDYEWWTRAAGLLTFKHVNKTVAKWRWHDRNMSSGSVKFDTSYEVKILQKLLKMYPIDILFPDEKRCNVDNEYFESIISKKISKRFFDLGEKKLANKYLNLSIKGNRESESVKIKQDKIYNKYFQPNCGISSERLKSAKLNIALVVHGFPPHSIGGTELYAYELAKELHSIGNKIEVICPVYNKNMEMGAITHTIFNGINVAYINILNQYKDLISEFYNIRVKDIVKKYFSYRQFDLVHFQHLLGFSFSFLEQTQYLRIPSIYTLHDAHLLCQQIHLINGDKEFCAHGPKNEKQCAECFCKRLKIDRNSSSVTQIENILKMRNKYILCAVNNVNKIIVPTKFLKDKITAFGINKNKIIYSTLGLTPFIVKRKIYNVKYIRASFLGNISYTKGLDLLIDAMEMLGECNIVLNIFGKIVDINYFKKIEKRINCSKNIRYKGAYSKNDLGDIFSSTDITIIPSRSENFPTVIRESLSANTPVISSRIGGIPEIIEDGKNGILFNIGNTIDLLRVLNMINKNPIIINSLSKGINKVKTISEDTRDLMNIYNGIVSN